MTVMNGMHGLNLHSIMRITNGRPDMLRLGRSVPTDGKVVAVAAQQACLNLAWSVLTDQQAGRQASKQALSVATQAM